MLIIIFITLFVLLYIIIVDIILKINVYLIINFIYFISITGNYWVLLIQSTLDTRLYISEILITQNCIYYRLVLYTKCIWVYPYKYM